MQFELTMKRFEIAGLAVMGVMFIFIAWMMDVYHVYQGPGQTLVERPELVKPMLIVVALGVLSLGLMIASKLEGD